MITQHTGRKAKENLPEGKRNTLPKNKDTPDNRSGEEQNNKDDDVTHDAREEHSKNRKNK